MEQIILPVLDIKVLQEKANEFALKGATEALKEYYSGYNGPFRKLIDEQLKKSKITGLVELPDIIGHLNKSLSAEFDTIVNTAIAKTYIPQVKRFLTRVDTEMSFSDFLKLVVEETDGENPDAYSIEMDLNTKHGWYDIHINIKESSYNLTLHEVYETKKDSSLKKKYHFLSMPSGYEHSGRNPKMTLKVDDATLELPFVPDVLKDDFCALIARMVFCGTKLTIDMDGFSEDMFPNHCHCD